MIARLACWLAGHHTPAVPGTWACWRCWREVVYDRGKVWPR